MGDRPDEVAPHLYADADFAGCTDTQRSTSGAHLKIEGPFTSFPLIGRSVRQGCVSVSTPEAEIVAAFMAYKDVMLPTLDIWDTILPTGYEDLFDEELDR